MSEKITQLSEHQEEFLLNLIEWLRTQEPNAELANISNPYDFQKFTIAYLGCIVESVLMKRTYDEREGYAIGVIRTVIKKWEFCVEAYINGDTPYTTEK